MTANSKNRIFANTALHLLVWGILFGFPFLFSPGEAPRHPAYLKTVLPLFFTAFVFYVNYFILVDKVLFSNKILLFIFINLVLIILCIWGQDWIRDLLPGRSASRGGRSGGSWRSYFLFRTAFSLVLTVGVSIAMSTLRHWRRLESERKIRETEQLRSTLTHLQYQIQPHFFFNSLNNIYSLVDISPDKAKDAIHRLSKLMRYTLHDANTDRVPLAQEITFLQNYIDLMRLRLTDKVRVHYDFPKETTGVQIAPLLFIPLVENSFKHGVSAQQPSFINLEMRIEDAQLFFTVMNTNFPKDERDRGGSGIGLENLQKRLQLLYPGQHRFAQTEDNGVFKTVLSIRV